MDPTILAGLIGGILATVGAVLGGIVTGWFALKSNQQSLFHTAKREERERGLAFRQQQLSQFYGPAQACMEELEESWQLLHEANKNVERFSQTQPEQDPSNPLLTEKQKAVIDYKRYLYTKEVTVFNKIKDIFTSNFGLAEPSTKLNYRSVVRFIENRNIIEITHRKLDITFTGEASSGLREKIASLYRNLIDINGQIRSQLETGEPQPIVEPLHETAAESSSVPVPTIDEQQWISAPQKSLFDLSAELPNAKTRTRTSEEIAVAPSAEVAVPTGRQQWPGRYTLLANKDSLDKP
jgi:hypothetical protein